MYPRIKTQNDNKRVESFHYPPPMDLPCPGLETGSFFSFGNMFMAHRPTVKPARWRGWLVAGFLHLKLRVRSRPKSVDSLDAEN
ncbi:hypothetical protein TNCV_4169641 [Trichonephila clavipes]|nr:hypothetical protein TNCV_4169641 [Trichonephila clavipes]